MITFIKYSPTEKNGDNVNRALCFICGPIYAALSKPKFLLIKSKATQNKARRRSVSQWPACVLASIQTKFKPSPSQVQTELLLAETNAAVHRHIIHAVISGMVAVLDSDSDSDWVCCSGPRETLASAGWYVCHVAAQFDTQIIEYSF